MRQAGAGPTLPQRETKKETAMSSSIEFKEFLIYVDLLAQLQERIHCKIKE
jgi:hypothetical protein